MRNTRESGDVEELTQWVNANHELKSHVLFQTSGSSGESKWVALSKTALLASARMVNKHLGVETGARWGLALPIYHVGGFGILARSFLSGGNCQVFHESWDPIRFARFVYTQSCEYISLVPTQVNDLISKRCICPANVKAVIVGGGSLTDSQLTNSRALGWPIFRSYGMTESASQIATGDDGDGWIQILPNWSTRVNSDGLFEWKGEAGFTGYVSSGAEGFELFDPRESGWFTTQDRVEIDSSKLRVLGRSDSLVKVLGELVDLAVIETKLKQQLGFDCVIFTSPDERRGVKLVAVVESTEPVTDEGFCGLEALESCICVEAFPRSPLGKIKRAELRKKISKLVDN